MPKACCTLRVMRARHGSSGETSGRAALEQASMQLRSGELLAAITYQGSRQEGDPNLGGNREELFNKVVMARSGDGGKIYEDDRRDCASIAFLHCRSFR